MRYLVVAIIGIALFAAGFLAADMVQSDADAQGTWHVEYFYLVSRDEAKEFIESLAADCAVDLEVYGDGEPAAIAYSCPD